MEKKTSNSDKKAQGTKVPANSKTKTSKNNLDQKKTKEAHHITEEPKYPQRGNTDPFDRTSSVY